jgi:uncharacterized membrane protein YoaK (UPF0700 family)
MLSTLHSPQTIFSWRHVPSWLMLTLAAGAVNAGAFLACQRFVTHVTGIATQIGLDVSSFWLMVDYALILGCFILGAAVSVLTIEGRARLTGRPWHAVPLLGVMAVLLLVALAGHAGVFGPFGGEVEQVADFALLAILAFAMGMQNATVATGTGMMIRTTHLTGPATDLGVHLALACLNKGEQRRSAVRGAALRAGKIVSFILGAAIMVPAVRAFSWLAFLLPTATVGLATVLSFIPSLLGKEGGVASELRDKLRAPASLPANLQDRSAPSHAA